MVKMGVLMSSTCRGCLQLTSLSMIDLVSSSPSQVTRELFQNSVDVFTVGILSLHVCLTGRVIKQPIVGEILTALLLF